MIKKFIGLLLCINIQYSAFCHNGQMNITGFIPDSSAGTTVQLRVFPYYFQKRWDADGVLSTAHLKNGHFSSRLSLKEPGYISITFPRKYSKQNISLFLIEPGDEIFISVSEKEIVFTGKGSEKYTCQYLNSKLLAEPWTVEEAKNFQQKKGYDHLVKHKAKSEQLVNKKLNTLYGYKNILSPIAFIKIELDLKGEQLYNLYSNIGFLLNYPASKEDRYEQIAFYTTHLKTDGEKNNPRLLIQSKFYTDWLFQKIKFDLQVKNYFSKDKVELTEIVSVVLNEYTGILREKLLLSAFIQLPPFTVPEIASLINAEQMITEPYFKYLFRHCKEKLPGMKAYNFSLEDEYGKIINLSDFKNKVVVIDFWISGCSFSKDAKEGLKQVKKKYAGNTNLVFLSVSADQNRQAWIESLKDSSFNIKGDVNLFTGGLGSDHPLLLKYDYQSFPQIMIIDKIQKVFAIKPPRPDSPDRFKAFSNLMDEVSR